MQGRNPYYVLPVLRDDRLVARIDAKADRKASVLRVLALHAEDGVGPESVKAAQSELDRLARWLDLDEVIIDRTFG